MISAMVRHLLIVSALTLIVACAPKSNAVATAPQPPAGTTPDSIRWVRDAAEYQAAVIQAYRLATARVEQAAPSRPQGGWAVVLDADETIINNSLYQLERARQGLGFSNESWSAWVKRREATALPGAAAFLSRVRALGGKIAVVTNRLGSECDDTRAVFAAQQLVFDAMLCRPDGTPSDKNPRFDAVASGAPFGGTAPMDVVLFVGDNILDFPRLAQSVKSQGVTGFTDFGVRYILIPNPMYGSWQ
jgi:5'-nucleotidase (lipoprotein e(P4) family)